MSSLYLKDFINTNQKTNIIKNSFPLEIGTNYMEKIEIQDGLLFFRTDFNLIKPIVLEAQKQKSRKLVITITIKGNTRYINNSDKKSLLFKEGFTTISLFKDTEGFREFKDNIINQVRLILNEEFLLKNFQKSLVEQYFYNNKNLQLLNFSLTSIESQFLINDILNCKLIGEIKKIYIESKILELLTIELQKIEEKKDKIYLDEYDKNALYKAKNILFDNIENPPSIVELAKMVHLSEVKLKQGFKIVYKTSPYQLLLDYKMNLAKRMLQSGEYNINEVALKIGYKFANNFTNAFYKKFKIRPKDIAKNKKYYI